MTEEEKKILIDWCKTFDVEPIETEGLSQEAVLKAFILWSEKQIEESI